MLVTKLPMENGMREELASLVKGKLLFDVSMSQHTTFGVGGLADVWVEPAGVEDLGRILDFCLSKGLDRYVVGQGTNMLVRDGGIRGVVIRLADAAFRQVQIQGTRVVAGAGMPNMRFLDALRSAELGGLEFICGIPGGVGGGVLMNAGAHAQCIADWLTEITLMDSRGHVRSIPRSELDFEYRHLKNVGDSVIVSAAFSLHADAKENISSKVAQMLEIRNATQPKGSSPGCVFKNPAGMSAGKLIDTLGLKGLRVGGAWVSSLHGNFILNDRTASCKQVIELIEKVRAEVLARSGIRLETEVKIIGEE